MLAFKRSSKQASKSREECLSRTLLRMTMTKRLRVAAVHVTKSFTCDLGKKSTVDHMTEAMLTRYVITASIENTTTNS